MNPAGRARRLHRASVHLGLAAVVLFVGNSAVHQVFRSDPGAFGLAISAAGFAVLCLCVACAIGSAAAETRFTVRRLEGRCIKCGYDLRASSAERCPECGTRPPPPSEQNPA